MTETITFQSYHMLWKYGRELNEDSKKEQKAEGEPRLKNLFWKEALSGSLVCVGREAYYIAC